MSGVRCPASTLPRRTHAHVHGGSACRSTTPSDGTRKRFLQTSEASQSDCPAGGRDRVHAQLPTSIAQATGDRECLQATTEWVEQCQKLPVQKMTRTRQPGSEGPVAP